MGDSFFMPFALYCVAQETSSRKDTFVHGMHCVLNACLQQVTKMALSS